MEPHAELAAAPARSAGWSWAPKSRWTGPLRRDRLGLAANVGHSQSARGGHRRSLVPFQLRMTGCAGLVRAQCSASHGTGSLEYRRLPKALRQVCT
eukprot:scaffold2376_cov115-Isochrysis_galbana.AAC.5